MRESGDIVVRPLGILTAGGYVLRCAVGRCGIGHKSVEGDGVTPVGRFPLRRVFYRADRLREPPRTALPVAPIQAMDTWCDDAASPAYNRFVTLPHPWRHERLWRDDGLYDVVVVIGFNDDPVVAGRGSAIFLHVARPDYEPTDGCVALALPDLLTVLAACGDNPMIRISREAR